MRNKRIMVVEDEAIINRELRVMLQNLGYEVCAWSLSGEEAIEKAQESVPDLILMDIKLAGEKDGIEAAQNIRTKIDVPIVYLTAQSDEKTIQRAKLTNPAGYLLKPATEHDLRVTIETACYKFTVEEDHRHYMEDNVACRNTELQNTIEQLQEEITQRKRAEAKLLEIKDKLEVEVRKRTEELIQAQKMEAVGLVAVWIAHDFNNALTTIHGHCELMAMDFNQDNILSQHLDEITKSVDQAASLTSQLLAFSHKQIIQPKIVDLNDMIIDMDKLLQSILGEHFDLVKVLAPILGVIKIDPGQMKQIIIDMTINARDAMPMGGKLTIETDNVELDDSQDSELSDLTSGPHVMLIINDTGSGMDDETRGRIFEPFFTTKRLGKGKGIGLSAVWDIVQQAGGQIQVWSELSHGTTFKIYFPRVEEQVKPPQAPELTSSLLPGTETILVVEDDDALRNVISKTLRKCGYTVLEARHGMEAMIICEKFKEPLDLVLTDLVMPVMNGYKLADCLSATHKSIKVLYMSGHTTDDLMHEGALGEGVNFISKPFNLFALSQKIRRILDEKIHDKN